MRLLRTSHLLPFETQRKNFHWYMGKFNNKNMVQDTFWNQKMWQTMYPMMVGGSPANMEAWNCMTDRVHAKWNGRYWNLV